VALGLRHAGDPGWYYRLTREQQVDVLAVAAIERDRS
jgi:hypothetical protein